MKIATAYVELRIDRAKAEREARDSAQRMSSTFAQVFSVAAFTTGVAKMTQSASNLQQSVGATEAVFKEASGTITTFAKSSAESFGISETAARELTAQMGSLLNGFGFTRDEAAKTSVQMTQLGADLAATFGGKPEEAVAALGSALKSEFDPLESFGISLNAAAIAAKAVELGLADSTTSVDANAKATATLALINEKAADAQGAFARESGTAAGQQAIASAKAEEAAASFGETILPIYTRVLELVGKLADGFGALPAPVQQAIIGLTALAVFAGPIGKLKGVVEDIGSAFRKTAGASSALGGALAIAGVAAVGLSLRAQQVAKSNAAMVASFEALSRSTDEDLFANFVLSLGKAAIAGEGYDDAVRLMAESNLEGAKRVLEHSAALDEQGKLTEEQAGLMERLRVAIVAEDEARARAATTTTEHSEALDKTEHSAAKARASLAGASDATTAQGEAALAARPSNEELAEAFEANSKAAEEALQAIRDLYTEMIGNIDTQRAYERSLDDSETALLDYAEQLKEAKGDQEGITDAARDAADQLIDTAKAYAASKGAALDSATGVQLMIESLYAQATALSEGDPLRQNLLAYIAELQKIPTSIDTQIRLRVTGQTVTKGGDVIGVRAIGDEAVFSARGRVVRGGSRLLSWLGDGATGSAGDEVVLPLGDTKRMRELLAVPGVGDRVANAFGDGGAQSAGGSVATLERPATAQSGPASITLIIEGRPFSAMIADYDQQLYYDVLAGRRP